MSPTTTALLRSIVELVTHAQARPTDAVGIARRRLARATAEQAWIAAGTPDIPDGVSRPSVIPEGTGKRDENDKDWSATTIDVEVRKVTDKAVLLDAGNGDFWCPLSVIIAGIGNVAEGAFATLTVPAWVTA